MIRRFLRMTCLGCLLITIACNGSGSAGTSTPAATSTAGVASPTAGGRTAQLSELKNDVRARAVESAAWQTASEGETLAVGGGAQTGDESRARIDITDGTLLRLAPNSQFTLVELSPAETDPVTKLTLETGKLFVWVTQALGSGSFEVDTPSGVATVRGSLMSAKFDPANGRFAITCLEGQCRLALGQTVTDLVEGQKAEIPNAGRGPLAAQLMDEADFDDWAANFPGLQIIINRVQQRLQNQATPTPTPVAVSAAQTACDYAYFPLRDGATWTYTNDRGETVTWTAGNIVGDAAHATAEVAWTTGAVSGVYHWACDVDGLRTYDFGVIAFVVGGFAQSDISEASGVFLPPAEALAPGYTWANAYKFQASITQQGVTFAIPVAVERAFTLTGMEPIAFNGQTYDGLQATEELDQTMSVQTAAPGAGAGLTSQTQHDTFVIEMARGVGFTRIVSTVNGETVTDVLAAVAIP